VITAFDDPRSDGDLIADIAVGDGNALVVLYGRHAAWLLLRLTRRCSDETLVDEVLQDTFMAVWKGASGFTGGEAGPWLWTIAARRLVDAVRASATRTKLFGRLSGHRAAAEPSAEDAVLVALEHGDLGAALNRLSPELRSVIQATVLDGLTTAEAAKLLGIPRNTVKTRAMRARVQLREELT
jgi:RNA polymerase sigma-70 factor (ECF subfamily)